MWGKAFAAALAILLVGLGFHGYQLYSAARGIELTRVSIASFELKGRPIPTYIFLQLDLYLRNPTSTYIELERLSYKIYINDRFAAEGEKEHIFIPASSETPVRLPVEIATSDILNLVISLMREGGRNLDVEVKGLMHIPIKLFGVVRAFTVSMPFQATQTYTIPSTLAPPATPTPPTTPPGPYTPPAASGHTDLHYDQSIKTAEVDRPNVKLKLYLIVKGPVGLDWRVNSTDVQPGGYLELATIGSGRLDMKLAIADMRITLAGKTVEIAYREQKLGVVDVPFKEKNIPIKIPIDGAFLIVNLKMKAELIHRAGISQPSLSQKQSEMNETARFSIRVEEPKGARLVYAQNLNTTISTSISIDGILSTQDLPIQTYTLYPEEELIELIALP